MTRTSRCLWCDEPVAPGMGRLHPECREAMRLRTLVDPPPPAHLPIWRLIWDQYTKDNPR